MIGNFVGKGSADTMLKSVYDTNNDGHVDIADSVEVGSGDVIKFGIDSQNRYGYIEDGEATVHPFADAPNEITYADWLLLTPQQQESGKWLVTDVPVNPLDIGPATTATLGLVKPDGVTISVSNDGTISGGGNTVSKTRYQISSSSWSSSANSDGYYTLTTTLNPAIGSSPDVYVAGSADGTQPTDTEKGQFAYVKRCKVNGSTLTLYASSKPSSTFYIWVEGVNGTGSGDIVGNVIQPNGESSGGSGVLTPFTLTQNDRLSNVQGGYRVDGDIVTVDLFARLLVEPANTIVFPDLVTSGMDSRIVGLPVPRYRVNVYLDLLYLTYTAENDYAAYANGFVLIDPYPEDSASLTHLVLGKYSNLNLSQQNIYIRCYGTYQKQ